MGMVKEVCESARVFWSYGYSVQEIAGALHIPEKMVREAVTDGDMDLDDQIDDESDPWLPSSDLFTEWTNDDFDFDPWLPSRELTHKSHL